MRTLAQGRLNPWTPPFDPVNLAQGKMVAVIPFVGKVLDACKDSKVFKPTNPWVSTIMSLLAEIHGLEKVKLNITFEIEIICQNMGLKVTDLKPSSELKGRKVSALLSIHPDTYRWSYFKRTPMPV